MGANDIPEWALQRACYLAAEGATTTVFCLPTDSGPYLPAFARYIAAHEEAPVDPLLNVAREIADKWTDRPGGEYSRGKRDDNPALKAIVEGIQRGIELAKAGEA